MPIILTERIRDNQDLKLAHTISYQIPLLIQTRYNNAIMRQTIKTAFLIILALALAFTMELESVSAQAGSASDLINGVNSLRQSKGLAPYTVDSFLMSFAQTHSDYMASLGTWTHTRADGTTATNHGIKENVAMGTNMSVEYCIYTIWADWIHWNTMVGYSGGKVGAGVTIKNNSVYYTLNVLPEGSAYVEDVNPDETTTAPLQDTPQYQSPVITVTPDQDGIIMHTVQYGETLWSIAIAYDVTIEQILENSGLHLETTEVREGQQLLIRTATDPSPSPEDTAMPDPGTPTPTEPRSTRTPLPTRTPAPTVTPTRPPSIFHRTLGDGKNVGLGLILISGIGLLLVIYLGFLKKS
jgi:uncharacterized protein YkwD